MTKFEKLKAMREHVTKAARMQSEIYAMMNDRNKKIWRKEFGDPVRDVINFLYSLEKRAVKLSTQKEVHDNDCGGLL